MRATGQSSELKAAAYAGTYVVVLAWDTLDGTLPTRPDLLGYAVERAEFDAAGNEVDAIGCVRSSASRIRTRDYLPEHQSPRQSTRSRASNGPTTPRKRAPVTYFASSPYTAP